MKFRTLVIHNIASIEHAELAFDREPLDGADVFLISGVTGAGKSTILDSICLALFNAVPRLGTGRSSDRFNGISSRDYKQLLRTGTKEGYVELSFRGNNGREYVARWRVWLTAKKINNQWTLIPDGDTAMALSKEKLIEAEVTAALSIDYEQFVRTSLLAQGEFTRFLNSDDAEKARILAKLTGVDRFAEVGREIYRMYVARLSAEQTLRDQSQVVKLLDADRIAAIKEEIAAMARQAEAEAATAKALDIRLQWLARSASLQRLHAEAEAALKDAAERRDSEATAAMRRLVADYETTAQARQSLGAAEESRRRRAQIDAELSALLPKWRLILAAVDALRESRTIYEKDLAATDAALASRAARAAAFEVYEDVIAAAEGILRGRADAARLEKEIAAQRASLPSVRSALDEADSALTAASQAAVAAERTAAQAQQRFSALDSGAVLDALTAARDRLQSFRLLVRMAAVKADVARSRADIDALALRAARNRQLFAELDLGHKEWAAIARASLTKGCTCPVCRRTVDELPPVEDILNRQWLAAKEACEADEKALALAQKELSAHEATLAVLERSHEQLRQRLDSIPAAETEREALLVTLTADLDRAEKANEAAAALKAETDKARAEHLKALQAKELAEKRRADAQAALKAVEMRAGTLDEKRRQTLDTADSEQRKLMSSPALRGWCEGGAADVADFLPLFKTAYREYEQLRTQRQTLSVKIEQADVRLGSAADALAAVAEALPAWAAIDKADKVPEADVFSYLGSFVSKVCSLADRSRQLGLEVERLDIAVARFMEENGRFSLDALLELSRRTDAEIERMKGTLADIDLAFTRCEAASESVKRQIAEHEDHKPEFEADDTAETLAQRKADSDSRLAELNRTTGALTQQLDDDDRMRRRQTELLNRLAAAEKETVRWGRLNSLFGDKEGSRFRNIALSFVLENLLDAANRYLAMLTDRYRLRGVEGSYLILLEDAYNGYRSRPVATSSGGESFMVSLSLALALADFGSGFVADTLFIDEGFGTLSGEPLQRAVGMLRSLNRSSGRRVGIISHIAELKSEIPVQIHVDADPSRGASTVSVTAVL